MNWIAGIYNTDGRPIDPVLLERLAEPVRSGALDGCRSWSDGPVGFVCCMRHTTPESLSHHSAPVTAAAKLPICFDGRLDNRTELMHRLDIRGGESEYDDSDLLTYAYEVWGDDCFAQLLGDFAVALWDGRNRRLVCARDALGVRPLFYYFDGKTLIWASRIGQLLTVDGIRRTLDREYFANYLVRLELPLALTPYTAIKRLQPAHMLVVERGRMALRRYWQPDPSKQIRYSSDADYEGHFRALFANAVKVRLRSVGPVWCELSGGLDSSSIACVASGQMRNGSGANGGLGTISWVYDRAYHSDERRWIFPVITKCGATPQFVSCDDYYPLRDFDEASLRWDEPSWQSMFYARLTRTGQLLDEAGVRVVLSGEGGDQAVVPGYTPVYIADLFCRLGLRQGMAELVRWQKHLGFPLSTVFINSCAIPLLRRSRVRFGFQTESDQEPIPPWIEPAFASTMRLRERAVGRLLSPPYWSRAYQSRCERIMETVLCNAASTDRCEYRYPYVDRALVEFVLAIPWTQLFRPGEPKSLLRRAMVNILPEEVRTRRCNRGPDHAFFLALEKEWPRLESRLRDLRISAVGFVDRRAFSNALTLARFGAGRSPDLLTALALENWLIGAGV
jgi:asparagine synthase (glutamine-hydrolysing)